MPKEKSKTTGILDTIVVDENDGFSFTKHAKDLNQKLATIVLEKAIRHPIINNDNPALAEMEQRAHKSLQLADDEPFMVIARMRFLDDLPKVIHRAYLDPKRFPSDFLELHDFANESLGTYLPQPWLSTYNSQHPSTSTLCDGR